MPTRLRSWLPAAALFAVLATCAALLAVRVIGTMHVERGYDVRYIPDGKKFRWLEPGVNLSVADAYWLAAVQYIGDQHYAHGRYERLYPLVDLITDLDPRHGYAYQTAGIVLSTADRLEESDAILKKGMEKGPGWWSYPFYLAFNDFFYRADYPAAARWARIAARTPGASLNIAQLALSMEVKAGDPQSAVDFLREMHASARDEASRDDLEQQLRIAILQRDFAALDAAVARFSAERGQRPRSLDEVRRAGFLDRIPEEPFGGRYELHPDGTVHSTARDFRFHRAERGRGIPAADDDTPPLLQRRSTP